MNTNSGNSSLFIGFFLSKITVFLLFTAVFSHGLFAQSSIKSNLSVFEQEISGELDKIFYYPEVNRDVKFVFFVTSARENNEEKKFIESVIRKNAEKNRLKIAFAKDEQMDASDSIYNKCRIVIQKLKTSYPKLIKDGFLGEKTMRREVTSLLNVTLTSSNGTILVSDDINTKYADEILYEDYEVYQSSEYLFTQSSPPDISFFESIFFPAAVVTLSAVAAILFFTIRSK